MDLIRASSGTENGLTFKHSKHAFKDKNKSETA